MAVDDYKLAPEVAEKLRVPPIRYPHDIVPQRVIKLSVISKEAGLTTDIYPALAGDMPLFDLLKLVEKHYKHYTKH